MEEVHSLSTSLGSFFAENVTIPAGRLIRAKMALLTTNLDRWASASLKSEDILSEKERRSQKREKERYLQAQRQQNGQPVDIDPCVVL